MTPHENWIEFCKLAAGVNSALSYGESRHRMSTLQCQQSISELLTGHLPSISAVLHLTARQHLLGESDSCWWLLPSTGRHTRHGEAVAGQHWWRSVLALWMWHRKTCQHASWHPAIVIQDNKRCMISWQIDANSGITIVFLRTMAPQSCFKISYYLLNRPGKYCLSSSSAWCHANVNHRFFLGVMFLEEKGLFYLTLLNLSFNRAYILAETHLK